VTLIELLTTISIMAILLALVAPSFHEVFLNSRLTNQANGFLSSLTLARSEAIKTNARVTMCKSANGTSCLTTGGWQAGWIVFRDTNGDGSRQNNEPVIQRGDPLVAGFLLMAGTGEDTVKDYVSFTSLGTPKLASGAVQTGALTLCRATPSVGSSGRRILIGATGHVRIEPLEGLTACP
jgi:type IV fimbrial biogenesis protein FimT